MSDSKAIQWKRILVEALAIVASILLAFAIDAWWQDRNDSAIELQYLEAVREDLVRSVELLDSTESLQRTQVDYLHALLETTPDTPLSDELREWIYEALFSIRSYQPQLSALDELESSGQSELIRSPEVRRAMAVVRQRIDAMENGQQDLQQTQQGFIDPFLVDNFNLADLMPDLEGNDTTDLSALGTSELNSRIAFKLALRSNISRTQDDLREAYADALALIEAELEDRGRP
jgi:hypothetical protein